jgi:parallel beta-helix repeat protein
MGASHPTFSGNTFSTNDVAGISMDPTSLLTLSGNTATGNATNGVNIRSGSITSSVTWDQTNLPYRFVGTVNVNAGSTLTIGPDMIFKGNPNQRLVISGKLLVNGSSGHSVYFTSYRDDSIGGDTDGGGSSSGSPGDWGWIEFAPSSDDTSTISYAVVRYGGYINASPYTTGDLYIHDASPNIQDSIISYSLKHGIYADSANPILTCNDIFSNHDDGIFNYTPAYLVIAEDHWWGSGTGPYHPILNPTGTGNPVSDGVDFIPWLSATCHTPPNAPTNLSASAISKNQIGLTWLDNSDETEFHLERSPNGSMNWQEISIVGANLTSYTDEPLTCSTLYYYRVRAYRGRDNQFSEYSNTAYAATLPCFALFLPLVIK